MSAITAAVRQLDDVAAEGDLAADPLPSEPLELEPLADPTCPTGSASTRRPCTASRSTGSRWRCWT
jgi:hypothetical protein